MPTKNDQIKFGTVLLSPVVEAISENVDCCYMEENLNGDIFFHIAYKDGTERLVFVSGCTFKKMTEKVLEHI